jgi:FkbM family methyltransferase
MNKLLKAVRNPAAALRAIYFRFFRFWKTHVVRDEFYVSLARWYAADGDNTLRFDYALTTDSLVLDLGGYQGDFSQRIVDRFGCRVFLFEPSADFFRVCRDRFENDPRVTCFNFALSNHDGNEILSARKDNSSLKQSDGLHGEAVSVRRISAFLQEQQVASVDLIKINIEGGEFDVLPDLIESGLIRRFRNIQVQFHNFIPNAQKMRGDIRRALELTHQESWNYTFVWESWSRRDAGE